MQNNSGFFSSRFVLAGLVAFLLLSPGLVYAGDKITITGSTTVLPIAQKATEDYMKLHPGILISVSGTGSGDGIKSIIDGMADIGGSSRDMKQKEIDFARSKGVNPVKHVVALDCIVPIVHRDNPVNNLSMEQLKKVYTGQITNWKQLGWSKSKKIIAISRDSSSGTFEVWNKLVLKKELVRPDSQMQASNGAVAQAVASNKYAIGYIGLGYLNKRVKAVSVNGVTASKETAKDKSYPIVRELFMFTRGAPQGAVADFLNFVISPEGQNIVKQEGYVPIN
jgi:phosphate transport system substrate-binding protein